MFFFFFFFLSLAAGIREVVIKIVCRHRSCCQKNDTLNSDTHNRYPSMFDTSPAGDAAQGYIKPKNIADMSLKVISECTHAGWWGESKLWTIYDRQQMLDSWNLHFHVRIPSRGSHALPQNQGQRRAWGIVSCHKGDVGSARLHLMDEITHENDEASRNGNPTETFSFFFLFRFNHSQFFARMGLNSFVLVMLVLLLSVSVSVQIALPFHHIRVLWTVC